MNKFEIEKLIEKVDSHYSLVIVAAKRARQVNDYISAVKKQEIPHVVPPQVQLEEAVRDKPVSIALKEIIEGKISYERKEEEKIPS